MQCWSLSSRTRAGSRWEQQLPADSQPGAEHLQLYTDQGEKKENSSTALLEHAAAARAELGSSRRHATGRVRPARAAAGGCRCVALRGAARQPPGLRAGLAAGGPAICVQAGAVAGPLRVSAAAAGRVERAWHGSRRQQAGWAASPSSSSSPTRRLTAAAAARTTGVRAAEGAAAQSSRAFSNHVFTSYADAPPPAGSSVVSIKVGGDAKAVSVEVKAGKATAKATYPADSIKTCAADGGLGRGGAGSQQQQQQ